MPIAVLVAIIAAYVYVLFAVPRVRRWWLPLGVAVLAVVWVTSRGQDSARPTIAIDALAIDGVELDLTPRGADLSGRVLNGSPDHRLLDMTLRLRLHDCPDPALAATECPVIGEATAVARPDAPPGQIRGFTGHFIFGNLAPVLGTLTWEWEILSTRAADR